MKSSVIKYRYFLETSWIIKIQFKSPSRKICCIKIEEMDAGQGSMTIALPVHKAWLRTIRSGPSRSNISEAMKSQRHGRIQD